MSRFVAILVASILVGCQQYSGSAETPLASLALSPDELPPSCGLYWKSAPMPMSVATESEREYFTLLTSFWVGEGHTLDALDVGLSNVYSNEASENALVVFSVRFTDSNAAIAASEAVRSRQAGNPSFWGHREGRIAVFSSQGAPIPGECVELIQHHVLANVRAVA